MDAEKEKIARTMPILMREKGVEDYYVEFWRLWMQALRHTQPHLLAYLIYMVQRLLYMKTLLRPGGSIYLHCDPTASHYIKVMMDGIFGHKHFRNEIIWKRANAHNDPRGYGRISDAILFYTKGDKYTWNTQYTPYREEYYESHYKKDKDSRWYRTVPLDAPRWQGKSQPLV
jgi:adenine specific DNA methylase Mod